MPQSGGRGCGVSSTSRRPRQADSSASGLGQGPHEVAGEQGVEPFIAGGRLGGVADQEADFVPGCLQLGPGLLDHPRGQVDAGDPVPGLGDQLGQGSGAAADVQRVAWVGRQPGGQALGPCGAGLRGPQAMVRFVVEAGAAVSQ